MRKIIIIVLLILITVFTWTENINDELLKTNDPKQVLELIKSGADVNYNNRQSPLISACIKGNLEKVKILLENGANPNLKTNDEFKTTAIMYSVWFGQNHGYGIHQNRIPITKLLIKYNADVNVRAKNNLTALDYAIEANGFTENNNKELEETLKVVKLLLDAGADKNSIKEALKSVKNQVKLANALGKQYSGFQEEINLLQSYLNFNPTYKAKVNLNLRETPSINSRIIIVLEKDILVASIEKGKDDIIDGIKGKWLKIKTVEGITGWCFSAYLEEIKKGNWFNNLTKGIFK